MLRFGDFLCVEPHFERRPNTYMKHRSRGFLQYGLIGQRVGLMTFHQIYKKSANLRERYRTFQFLLQTPSADVIMMNDDYMITDNWSLLLTFVITLFILFFIATQTPVACQIEIDLRMCDKFRHILCIVQIDKRHIKQVYLYAITTVSCFNIESHIVTDLCTCQYNNNHGLRGSASPVLTATGLVNGRWQFPAPDTIDTP